MSTLSFVICISLIASISYFSYAFVSSRALPDDEPFRDVFVNPVYCLRFSAFELLLSFVVVAVVSVVLLAFFLLLLVLLLLVLVVISLGLAMAPGAFLAFRIDKDNEESVSFDSIYCILVCTYYTSSSIRSCALESNISTSLTRALFTSFTSTPDIYNDDDDDDIRLFLFFTVLLLLLLLLRDECNTESFC